MLGRLSHNYLDIEGRTVSHSEVLDVLTERGFVKDVSDRDGLRKALANPIVAYCGYDATAPSLHIGNQITIMMLSWLQRFGHHPIALLGGGTTMVGDPSGRSKERPLLSPEIIAANIERLRPQMQPFIDFEAGAMILDNSSWLLSLNLVDFLRDVGSQFNVHQMLSFDTYRTRLEHGLTFLELSYQLLQGYDYLHLHRERGCVLEVGGSDQWANILAGVDLIRKSEGAEAFALVCPLMTLPGGAKMSKSEGSAIWLSPEMTSPFDYYQYWINAADEDVENLLSVFTYTPMDEVRRIGRLEGAEMRAGKEFLAYEVTSIVHGTAHADKAREASRALFSGGGSHDAAPTVSADAARLERGVTMVELLEDVKLAPSRREARRLIDQGGVTLNGESVDSADRLVTSSDLAQDGCLLIRVGKKRYLRVRPE